MSADGSENQAQTTEAAQTTEQQAPEQWFWADGVPGQGARPDYLPAKYKSVADAAKARSELEKKLGSFTGAPEAYETEHLGMDTDQHILKEIMSIGKELNLNQDGFDKFVGRLLTAREAEEKISLQEEVKKMGEDGVRQLKQYEHFTKHHLKPEEAEFVKGWVSTAEDMKIFNSLVNQVYGSRIPTTDAMHMNNYHENVADIRKEMTTNLERYQKDAAYRADLRSRLDYAEQREKR